MPRGKAKSDVKPLVEKKICDNCKSPKNITADYYSADECLFSEGRFHMCKSCVEEIINKRGFDGFIMILRTMNRPFIMELYKDNWKDYIRQISSLPQYRHMTFDNSSFENKKYITKGVITDIHEEEKYTEEEVKQLKATWGKSLTIEDLEYLQFEFEKLINSYECDSYAMELLFQEAAQQRLTIKKLREAERPVDKELKTLQDLLGSANIKPVQETGANATEQSTFGTLIKKYENERPIPEPDAEWKDVDGIKKYVQVWFLGHLCRMLGINNDYSRMYDEEISKYTVETPSYEDDEEFEDGDVK